MSSTSTSVDQIQRSFGSMSLRSHVCEGWTCVCQHEQEFKNQLKLVTFMNKQSRKLYTTPTNPYGVKPYRGCFDPDGEKSLFGNHEREAYVGVFHVGDIVEIGGGAIQQYGLVVSMGWSESPDRLIVNRSGWTSCIKCYHLKKASEVVVKYALDAYKESQHTSL